MKRKILKSVFLLVAATMATVSTHAVERNSSFEGIAASIQPETTYYMFNLGTSLYFGIDYDWTARAAVNKNPFQQVKLHVAAENSYYNIESVKGLHVGKYVFKDGTQAWADQGKEGFMPNKDTYWSIVDRGNGVYQLKNRSTATDTYFGPISTTNRRVDADLAIDNANSKWIFIPIGSAELEKFHVREALLFTKLNEVENIGGFSAELISSATAVYQNPSATLSQIKSVLADLTKAQYSLSAATMADPIDCSNFIVNPTIVSTASINSARPFGWENSTNSDGPNTFFVKGPEQNTMLEAWGYDYAEVSKFDYNQTLYGIPNGTYRLSASCLVEANESGETPNGNAGIYVTTGINDYYKGTSSLGTEIISSDLVEVLNNTIKIGVRKNGKLNTRYFAADDFTLTYYGQTTPAYSTDKANMLLTESASTSTFNVSGANLTGDITISTDVEGVTFSTNTISSASLNGASVEVTVSFDADASGATSKVGVITLTSAEAGTKTIEVITSKEEAFVPKANSGNLTLDPTMSDISKFGGWGSKTIISIKDEPGAVKSGAFCGKISEKEAGSFDAKLISALEANTDYTMFAWVNTNGTFNLAVTGSTAGQSGDVGYLVPNTEGVWQAVEFSFRTGENPTGTTAYFNNWGASGKIGYIDNWELYKKEDLTVGIDETELAEKLSIESIVGGVKIQSNEIVNITIFSITGQLVKQTKVDNGQIIISLPKGVYIINGRKAIAF